MQKLSRNRIGSIVASCGEAVGIKVSPHDLRRAMASYLANEKNMPMPQVQRIMGHRSLAATQYYVSVNDEAVKDFLIRNYIDD